MASRSGAELGPGNLACVCHRDGERRCHHHREWVGGRLPWPGGLGQRRRCRPPGRSSLAGGAARGADCGPCGRSGELTDLPLADPRGGCKTGDPLRPGAHHQDPLPLGDAPLHRPSTGRSSGGWCRWGRCLIMPPLPRRPRRLIRRDASTISASGKPPQRQRMDRHLNRPEQALGIGVGDGGPRPAHHIGHAQAL